MITHKYFVHDDSQQNAGIFLEAENDGQKVRFKINGRAVLTNVEAEVRAINALSDLNEAMSDLLNNNIFKNFGDETDIHEVA